MITNMKVRITAMNSLYMLLVLVFPSLLRRICVRYCPLQEFQGPKWAAYTRWWLLRTYASGHSARLFLDANKKYRLEAHLNTPLGCLKTVKPTWDDTSTPGKLARIGPNILLTNNLEISLRLLGPQPKYQRANWFDSLRFDPHHTSLASETDPVKHDALRRIVSAGVRAQQSYETTNTVADWHFEFKYTTKVLPDIEAVVDRRISNWISEVHEDAVVKYSNEQVRSREERKPHDIGRRRVHLLQWRPWIWWWRSRERRVLGLDRQEAPYAQYLSTVHGFFSIIYILSLIPAIKRRLTLTKTNNPGIGKILKVRSPGTTQPFQL